MIPIAVLSIFPLLAAAAGPDPRLASVNGEAITVSDLQKEFTRRHGGHQRFLAGEVEARRFLDLVIDRRLLIQEAERLELQGLPAIAAATRERLGREASLEDVFMTYTGRSLDDDIEEDEADDE